MDRMTLGKKYINNQRLLEDLLGFQKHARYSHASFTRDECTKFAENDFAFLSIKLPVSEVTKYQRNVASSITDRIAALDMFVFCTPTKISYNFIL